MSQLRRHEKETEGLNLQILVVTFEARERGEAYVRETRLPWPLLIDTQRVLYSAYGMGHGGWWAYLRLIGRGQRPRRPTGDIRQLGGDTLLDPMGMVALHHVGKVPADRPAVSALFERIRQRQGDHR